MKNRKLVTIIRRSCLTGDAVWIYRGPSQEAARMAYFRACRKEMERMKHWAKAAARRCANAARMLTDCTSSLPRTAGMTAEQKEAARQLQAIVKREHPRRSEFYEHIMAERRIRHRKIQNTNYDK